MRLLLLLTMLGLVWAVSINKLPPTEDELIEYVGSLGKTTEVDMVPPVISCINDVTRSVNIGVTGTTVTWTEPSATDNSGTVSLTSQTHTPGSFFVVGTTQVTYIFTDASGNTATCTFNVHVVEPRFGVDMVAPVITCIGDITRTVKTGTTGTTVTWTEPTATDNSGTVSLTSRTHAPGDTFIVGTSQVTYTFTDGSGNTATCIFNVNVTQRMLTNVACGILPGVGPYTRIVNGYQAAEGSWPWIGSLRLPDGTNWCGATLLNERWAITAAHCMIPKPPETEFPTSIVFGDNSLWLDPSPNRQISFFTKVYNHPLYNSVTLDNDISLLYLESWIEYTDFVQPICLATIVDEGNTYMNCQSAGWGALQEDGNGPDLLQEVTLPLAAMEQCNSGSDNIICAGGDWVNPGDTCQGDSGGPLICESVYDNALHLVGVVSYGYGCATPGNYGYYTRVSSYIEWIRNVVH
ncbi:chymotrypsin-like protease CTRL-1 isoform X2 [Amphiura filiformis]|uniref:chymotrypsin-like protease CTRL-1 isoform X2 n=1 Tax=Amphiura filiformis TaxID=82378 RepID=UPI003B227070